MQEGSFTEKHWVQFKNKPNQLELLHVSVHLCTVAEYRGAPLTTLVFWWLHSSQAPNIHSENLGICSYSLTNGYPQNTLERLRHQPPQLFHEQLSCQTDREGCCFQGKTTPTYSATVSCIFSPKLSLHQKTWNAQHIVALLSSVDLPSYFVSLLLTVPTALLAFNLLPLML